ncbi:alpha/beta hydrolase [Longimicrobium sp.]|uniref:alpha/beta hydrolase n=1 Tax=Longimicrobium sp. TaxID=2029185 RepID=UPI003B3B6295
MLQYEQVVPPEARDGAPLVVLLHGRGADRFDLLSLAPHLAPGAVVVTPQAPHSGTPWGYGPGWAWYRYLGGNTPEPQSFEQSQQALAEFLTALPGTLPIRTGPVVLGGFSQGGTMSVGYALRNPGAVPLALCLSGFLADHPTVRATPESVRGTRFFWGHGTMDPSIPFSMGEEGRAALRAAGAELETRDYPMGHGISPDEARDIRDWIARTLPAADAA